MGSSPRQLKQNKEDFLEILRSCTTNMEVPDTFYEYLVNSDFFVAPASVSYHESYEGGLVEHSLRVYENLTQINYLKMLGFSDSSLAKVALLHDLCKANFYKKTIKSKKMDDGQWVRTECYEVNDQLPLGHGEKSLYLATKYGVQLTEEQALAIRWHMGAYAAETRDYIGMQTLSNAMTKSKLAVALQIADLMSTYM